MQIAAQLNDHTVTVVIQAVPKAPRPKTDHPTYPVAADPVAAEPMEADPEAVVAVVVAAVAGEDDSLPWERMSNIEQGISNNEVK